MVQTKMRKREYMREYMRRWRKKGKERARQMHAVLARVTLLEADKTLLEALMRQAEGA